MSNPANRVTGYGNNFNPLAQKAINMHDPLMKALLEDLQANIVRHHKKKFSKLIFISQMDGSNPADLRDWISGQDYYSSAWDQLDKGEMDKKKVKLTRLLFFTKKGYDFLGQAAFAPAPSHAFRRGVEQKIVDRFPKVHKGALAFTDTLFLLIIAADQEVHLNSELVKIKKELGEKYKMKLEIEDGIRNEVNGLPEEWFGFRESMSEPLIFPDASKRLNKSGQAIKSDNLAYLNQFLVYDKGGVSDLNSIKNPRFSTGSYMALFKIKQDTEAFDKLTGEIAEKLMKVNGTKLNSTQATDLAKAYLMGRFDDGTPISLFEAKNGNAINDFNYQEWIGSSGSKTSLDDNQGNRCPFHAHIRQANPRNPAWSDKTILRRSVLYGDPDDSQKGRGLFFMSYQSNIENQLEFILSNWMQGDMVDGKPSRRDIFVSKPDGLSREIPKIWNQADTVEFKLNKALVHLEGACYFFAPSISYLKSLTKKRVVPEVEIQNNSQTRGATQKSDENKKNIAILKFPPKIKLNT